MKIIEAMKRTKDLAIKAEDLRKKVAVHHAALSFETPVYPDQAGQVREWMQSHHDTAKEIMRLKVAIQRTNLATPVTIEVGGKPVTHTLAEWIHRRRDLAKLEQQMWATLNDKGLKEGKGTDSQGRDMTISIVRHYDPKERDRKIEEYRSEPSVIDAALEVVNAVTDLIE